MSGLSLWLSPIGEQLEILYKLINQLAVENPGCLAFTPHATLISDEQVPDQPIDQILETVSKSVQEWNSTELGCKSRPFVIRFQEVQRGAHFYQCVLAAIVKSPDLLALNSTLKRNLLEPSKLEDLPTYFPHLSLVYGDLSDDQKQAIIDRLQSSGQLIPPATLLGLDKFEPTEILLVRTSGQSNGWKILGKVQISDGKIENLS
ncbi:hypothetical protein CROQUDRAFT_659678 [Cronartium quercuum f. sp. fusiforme G11]|uniref:RNA ligase/cyclic nucleotide phosphodiesterase family protein n=1 Tax=Cronartium quercuum f. sp. fusiforme G11 TaxID=708437 RepID=A0A9P6NIH7_9BASI|nr:hypothetical protein CROQUDRAFT_659678 [Cronartium quercuum f. sp. fusiforme G11]